MLAKDFEPALETPNVTAIRLLEVSAIGIPQSNEFKYKVDIRVL